ncbi:MAG: SBBP repeat-containing protein [Candidatus Hodarchaeales archaeon]|jgi:hypothetical protein
MQYVGIDNVQVTPAQVEVTIAENITFIDNSLNVWYADNEQYIASSFVAKNALGANRSALFTPSKIIQFELDPTYDHSRSVIIDPLFLQYSTYIGGDDSGYNVGDFGHSIVLDSANNIYIAGRTTSSDFPVENPYNSTLYGSEDVFVSKFSADGSTLLYSTYFGGSYIDEAYSIVLDSANNFYITGLTGSSNFPVVNAYDSTPNGFEDVFVSKFSADGSTLLYSTYIGGDKMDKGHSIALDSANNAYITGYTYSTNFPTKNARDPSHNGGTDVFVSKLSANGATLLYSTFLGGTSTDWGNSIVVDSANNAYITGFTRSTNFPKWNAYQNNLNGGSDAFVSKLSASGTSLPYSTFLGGSSDDMGDSIVLDSTNNAYITGSTKSSDFPTVNAYNPTHNGSSDVFVSKLSPYGTTLLYSTFIGGSGSDYEPTIMLDSASNIYISGCTTSTDFPTEKEYDPSHNGDTDVFMSKLSANGATLLYSTFLGGSKSELYASFVLDSANNVYITGATDSLDFPVEKAYDPTLNGPKWDAFLSILYFDETAPDITSAVFLDEGYAPNWYDQGLDSYATIRVSWTEANPDTIWLDISGIAYYQTSPSGSYTDFDVPISGKSDGSYNIYFYMNDSAGNSASKLTGTFGDAPLRLDNTAPIFGSWLQDADDDSNGDGYTPKQNFEDDNIVQGDFSSCNDGSGCGMSDYYIRRNGGSYGSNDEDGLNVQCTLISGTNSIEYKITDNLGNTATGTTGVSILYGTTAPNMDIDIIVMSGSPYLYMSDYSDITSGTLWVNTGQTATWKIVMDNSGDWNSGGAWKVVFSSGWGLSSNFHDEITPYESDDSGTVYTSATDPVNELWLDVVNSCGFSQRITLTTTIDVTSPSIDITSEVETSPYLYAAYGSLYQGLYGSTMGSTQAFTISGTASDCNLDH